MATTGDPSVLAWEAGLLPHHLQLIRDSAISDTVGMARGYRTITDRQELLAMGFSDDQARVPCLYVPAHAIGGHIIPFIRPDNPRLNEDGKIVKYDRPGGTRNILDVCPDTDIKVLEDPNLPLIITEGSRKVDAGISAGWPVVGLLGVWGWLGEINGKKLLIPDFREVVLEARQVYIAFDSDAITKGNVYQAQVELAHLMRNKDAIVRFIVIPPTEDGEKQGLDDYLAAGGTIQDLIADARFEPPEPADYRQMEDKFDFLYYMPDDRYYHTKTGMWCTGLALNKRVDKVPSSPKAQEPSEWVAEHQSIDQIGWFPGMPRQIHNLRFGDKGWAPVEKWRTLNTYEPSDLTPGRSDGAGKFTDHIKMVYPDNTEHLLDWLAFKVQYPGRKVNHALLLGGRQGIGKDTIIDSVIPAIGAHNVHNVGPGDFERGFNPFAKGILLRVSELRDLGDRNRTNFYEHMKTYVAAPPLTIIVNEKYRNEYPVPNVTGVIFTTNNRTSGLWIPEDDRRHYIVWSELQQSDIPEGYFKDYYKWLYEGGGAADVMAFLLERDLSKFDAGERPEQTDHMKIMVDASQSPETDDFWNILEQLEWPDVVTVGDLINQSNRGQTRMDEMTSGQSDFAYWAKSEKNRWKIPRQLEGLHYVKILNPDSAHGKWKYRGTAITMYAKDTLQREDQVQACRVYLEAKSRVEVAGSTVLPTS